ncbi:MAG: hypothetical protein ACRDTD_33155 [Pseudonocardiaceae bacterium]
MAQSAVLPALVSAAVFSSAVAPAFTVVIGDSSGAIDTTVTSVEFLDRHTARIHGCGQAEAGMLEQNTLVLTGFTSDGREVTSNLDDGSVSISQTPTGIWNCASGTLTAPAGAELSGLSGQQLADGAVNSWRVDNPFAGPAFGVRAMTHSGPGVPPRLATAAQASQIQQTALGKSPGQAR